MARSNLTIRGNHDRWVSGPNPTSMGASDRYAHSHLNQDHRSWLAALPASANNTESTAFSPVTGHRRATMSISLRMRQKADSCEQVWPYQLPKDRLVDTQNRVVLCVSQPKTAPSSSCPTGQRSLNPGSVGCPSYDDSGNDPHVSEVGSPHARSLRSSTSMRIRYPPTWSQSPMIGRRLLLRLNSNS